MQTPVVLGLSFSTRMLGLAVCQSNSIIDYSLKLHKGIWSPQKRELVLASLASCTEHCAITHLVLSIPDLHHQTNEFKELWQAIESFAHRKGIEVANYLLRDVYQQFGNVVARTRNGLMRELVVVYPELSRYYERELRNKNKYYVKMFEAIAVVIFHSQEQIKVIEKQG